MSAAILPNGLIPTTLRVYAVVSTAAAEKDSASVSLCVRRGVRTSTGFVPQMAAKSSAGVLDYVIDFTSLLTDTGDSIKNQGVTAVVRTSGGRTADLTVMWADTYDGNQAVVMLASGPPGTYQIVNVQVETVQGRTYVQQIIIPVSRVTDAVAPPSVALDAITVNGSPITVDGYTMIP